MGYTYDTGMLLAVERGQRLASGLHRRALDRGVTITVPAPVLAQAWRGGPQATLSRALRGCTVAVLDEARARSVGALCALAGTADVVDAAVVVGALERGDVVLTSDPQDLARLAAPIDPSLEIRRI